MKPFKGVLTRSEISMNIILKSRLKLDWGPWFLFRATTQWTPTMVAEALEEVGLCKITQRTKDGTEITAIYIPVGFTIEDVEIVCLGEEGIKKVDKWQKISPR